MKLTDEAVDRALAKHREVYGHARLWEIGYHVQCWDWAHHAFEENSREGFEMLYTELRNRWQVFRSPDFRAPRAEKLRRLLNSLDNDLKAMRLRHLSEPEDNDFAALWRTLCACAEIKLNKDGPSVMAVSKFLHFWNPRLFVIVDDAVVWNYVFNHQWLWSEIERTKTELAVPADNASYFAGRLGSYLAILAWGGRFLRENPELTSKFATYVVQEAGDKADIARALPLQSYDGAALEWLLLGLVEVPPEGVTLP
jgi:hypothetical protein